MTAVAVAASCFILAWLSPYQPHFVRAAAKNAITRPKIKRAYSRNRIAEKIGRALFSLFSPGRRVDDVLISTVGFAVVGLVVGSLLSLTTGVVMAIAFSALPYLSQNRVNARYRAKLESELVMFCDVLELAASGGIGVINALEVASRNFSGSVSALVRGSIARISAGSDLSDSLAELSASSQGVLRPFCRTIIDSHQYGHPIRQAIRTYRDELDEQRRVRAEAKARRAPILMIFPLAMFLMPAFILLTISPLVASELYQLRELFSY